MGYTKDKITINKGILNINLDAIKVKNQSTVFYLKAKGYAPEGSLPQEENSNLTEGNKGQDGKGEKEDWQKNLGIPS